MCRIIEKNNGSAPLTYKKFQRIIDGMDPPAKPVPTLTPQMLGSALTPVEEDHDEKFGVPTLEELGFDCDHLKPPVWVGGESEALSRSFNILQDIENYHSNSTPSGWRGTWSGRRGWPHSGDPR